MPFREACIKSQKLFSCPIYFILVDDAGLQIRRSNKDNLGIIGHISSEKHIL